MAKENQPTGMAHSALTVETTVTGTVCGNIVVADTLVLKSSSFLEGNITVTTLVIEPNAHLNGQCSMRTFQQ